MDFDRVLTSGKSDLLSIVIVGHYSYVIEDKMFEGNASEPLSGVNLVVLLNNDVTEARTIGRGDLLIGFGRGNRLYIKEDNSNFESYTIHFPGEQEMVV